MELRGTNNITILNRRTSNTSLGHIIRTSGPMTNDDGNDKFTPQTQDIKFIVNNSSPKTMPDIEHNCTESNETGDADRLEIDSILYAQESLMSVASLTEEKLNVEIVKSIPSIKFNRNVQHDTQFQMNNEVLKTVKILQRPCNLRMDSNEVALPRSSECVDEHENIELNKKEYSENIEDALKAKSTEVNDNKVPLVETESIPPFHEMLGSTSRAITILKRPSKTILTDCIKSNFEESKDTLLGADSAAVTDLGEATLVLKPQDTEKLQENTDSPLEERPILACKEISDNEIEKKTADDVENIATTEIPEEISVMQNITILKRPGDPIDDHIDNKTGHLVKTFSQRQKEYNAARLRIFGSVNSEDDSDDADIGEKEENGASEKEENIPTPPVETTSHKRSNDVNSFYIDVNNYQESDQPPAKPDKPPRAPPAIYSNGSQHPLQYFNQPIAHGKPIPNHSEQVMCFYPHYDCDLSHYRGSSNYIPNGSNIISSDSYVPTFTPMDFPTHNFGNASPNWMGGSNYFGFDDFAYYSHYAPSFVSDQTYYCTDQHYVDADQMHQALYVQQRCYDGYTMERASV